MNITAAFTTGKMPSLDWVEVNSGHYHDPGATWLILPVCTPGRPLTFQSLEPLYEVIANKEKIFTADAPEELQNHAIRRSTLCHGKAILVRCHLKAQRQGS